MQAVVCNHGCQDAAGNMQMFEINNSIYSAATLLNTSKENTYYVNYVSSKEKDRTTVLKDYRSWYDDTGDTTVSNCAYQIRMMEKYVLPPQFDFMKNKKVKPHVQYIFQFRSTIKESDLANLWQNLYPENSRGPGTVQHSRITPGK